MSRVTKEELAAIGAIRRAIIRADTEAWASTLGSAACDHRAGCAESLQQVLDALNSPALDALLGRSK